MNGSKEKEVKKAKDGAGRGTGKARNPGALSTVGPVKNQEEGGLPSMMWRGSQCWGTELHSSCPKLGTDSLYCVPSLS